MIDRIFRAIRTNLWPYLHAMLAITAAAAFFIMAISLGPFLKESLISNDDPAMAQSVASLRVRADESDMVKPLIEQLMHDVSELGAAYVEQPVNATIARTSGATDLTVVELPDSCFGYYLLTEGTAPQKANDIALTLNLARRLNYSVGDSLTLTVSKGTGNLITVPMKITGFYLTSTHRPNGSAELGFVTGEAIDSWAPILPPEGAHAYVTTAPGHTDTELLTSLAKVPDITVHARSARATTPTGDAEVAGNTMYAISLISALIILTIASFLVRHSLDLVMERKRRDIQLLHRLGASSTHIMWRLYSEFAFVAVVALILGCIIGTLGSLLIPVLLRSGPSSLIVPAAINVSLKLIAVAFVAGMCIFLLSAARPIRHGVGITRPSASVALIALVAVSSALLGSGLVIVEASRLDTEDYLVAAHPTGVSLNAQAGDDVFSQHTLETIANLPGVEWVEPVHSYVAQINDGTSNIGVVTVVSQIPTAASNCAYDNSIIFPYSYAAVLSSVPDTVTLRGLENVTLEARIGPVSQPTVTQQAIQKLAGNIAPHNAWVQFSHDVPSHQTVTLIRDEVAKRHLPVAISTRFIESRTSIHSVMNSAAWLLSLALGTMLTLCSASVSITMARYLRIHQIEFERRHILGESRRRLTLTYTATFASRSCLASIVGVAVGVGIGVVASLLWTNSHNFEQPILGAIGLVLVQCVTMTISLYIAAWRFFRDSSPFNDGMRTFDL